MKVAIKVKNRSEAEAVRLAMEDKEIRALVIVVGHLLQLSSDRARRRAMRYVADQLAESGVA